MLTVGHGVEAKHVGVGARHLDGVGEQLVQLRAGVVGEGRRVVGDGVVVEHGQRGVEVVEARVDELQADDRHAGDAATSSCARRSVPKPVARQDRSSRRPADRPGPRWRGGSGGLEAVGAPSTRRRRRLHPRAAGRRSGRRRPVPLTIEATVGGVDHVGQARDRLDELDGVAELAVGADNRSSHCRTASSVSTGVEVSIQGLMAYSTVKCVGAVMA